MPELWQLYDEDCNPLPGKGAVKEDVYTGLLHGASHVWIWHRGPDGVEVLLQKRAANKRVWPDLYDISAAGHVDLGETPEQAAVRETEEEIGLTITPQQLQFVTVHRINMPATGGAIENEFRWIYLMELSSKTNFVLAAGEVEATEWKPLKDFVREVRSPKHQYVPQGTDYYDIVIDALEQATT